MTVKANDGNGGTDTIDVTLDVDDADEPPLMPTIVQVTNPAGNHIALDVQWSAGNNTGRPAITGWRVRERAVGTTQWGSSLFSSGNVGRVSSLTSGLEYELQIRAENAEGNSPYTASTTANTTAPATGRPTISGTAQVGRTLTASTSDIMDANGLTNVSFTYQWRRVDADGFSHEADISGATSSTFTPTTADVGKKVKVRVSFTDDAGFDESRKSDAYPSSGTITAAGTTNATGKPAITGTAQVGMTLTAGIGTIADTDVLPAMFPDDYTFQWVRVDSDGMSNPMDIGTDSGTYMPAAADVGKRIRVKVSFTDGGGIDEGPLESDATAAVTAADSTKVTLSLAPAAVGEEDGLENFTVTGRLDGAPRGDDTAVTVTVGSGTGAGAATAGTDFEAVSARTLTIDAGETSGTASFILYPVDDDVAEGDETATVGGTTTVGLAVVAVTLTIREDDAKGIELSTTAVETTEGETGDSYSVRLASEPTGTITVTAVPQAGSEVEVDPASLTFTPLNWDDPQEFTVSAVDVDDQDNGDQHSTIAHEVSGADYQGHTVDATVAVTVYDDDVPGLTIARLVTKIPEGTQVDAYTVKLNTEPTGPVTVTPSVPPGPASLHPTSLTFTTGDWADSQTVSINTINDADARDEEFHVQHIATGGGYGGILIPNIVFTIEDDEEEAFVVRPADRMLTVDEGDTNTFEVKLASEPGGTVTVQATPGAGSHGVTVTPSDRDFTAANWDDWEEFTVTAPEDDNAVDEEVRIRVEVESGDYAAPSLFVNVTTDDNDDPSTKVTLSVATVRAGGQVGTDEVDEDGGPQTIRVTGMLDGAPRAVVTQVQISVSGDTATAGDDFRAVTGFSLPIAGGNTSATRDFSFTPVDDDVAEGDETVTVGGMAVLLSLEAATLTILDDDVKGIELSTAAATTTEGETGSSYTVRLTSEPVGTVTVTAVPESGSEVVVTPATLTFTAADWDTWQDIEVSAAEVDDQNNGVRTRTVTHEVAGADYEGLAVDATVTVTVSDDDVPGVHVAPTAFTVTEGGTMTYTVKLNTQPAGEVTVTPAPGPGAELSLDPATLTFSTGNWNTAQDVMVTADHDDDAFADAAFTIGHGATSSDSDYNGLAIDAVAVTVTEDDEEALVPDKTAVTVPEGLDGADGDIAVKLATEPAGRVRVDAVVTGDTDVTVTPEWHRFDADDWDQGKTFRVRGAQDGDSDDDSATVAFRIRAGDDYGAGEKTVAVTVDDDDTPSTAVRLSVSPATFGESGGARAVTATVTLNGAPRADATEVEVRVSVATTDTATTADFEPVGTIAVTIPAGQTEGEASFTFTPVNDDFDEEDETLSALAFVQVPATGLGGHVVALTIVDDDTRGIAASPATLAVDEGDAAGRTYTVVLESKPTAAVTLTAGGHEDSDVTLDPETLTFAAANWDTAQTVTVTAGEDDDGAHDAVTLGYTAAGGDYEALTGGAVEIAVNDNDERFVTVSETALEIDEDGTGASYTVVLATEPVGGDVTVTPAPDADLAGAVTFVPATSLTFTAADWDTVQYVVVKPDHDGDKVNEKGRIEHTVASAGDYAAVKAAGIAVEVIDDDKTVPGAPRLAGTRAGYEQVRLFWQAPGDDGGLEIAGYEYEVDGDGNWRSTGGVALEHAVTGLVNEVSYSFRVRAVNTLGPGG